MERGLHRCQPRDNAQGDRAMFETVATVVGTVVTQPVTRELASGDRVSTFRLASTARRRDQISGDWVDNGTLYLTVNCWRRLADGVGVSVRRGDPVLVQGQLRTSEYRTRTGAERRDLEMRAHTVGPDLARCTAVVRRGVSRPAEETDRSDRTADTASDSVSAQVEGRVPSEREALGGEGSGFAQWPGRADGEVSESPAELAADSVPERVGV